MGASFVDNKLIWNVGYGSWGPYDGTAAGFGTLHAGTNVVDSHDTTGVYFTNQNTAGTAYESSTGPGDSGGPMFFQSGNVWYIAAEVYGVTGDSRGFVDTLTYSTGAYNFLLSTIRNGNNDQTFNFAPQAAPTALQWDADPTTDGLQDGVGTWDSQRPNFYSSATGFNYQFENAQANDVIFGGNKGTAGVVTIAKTAISSIISTGGVTAHNLTFNAATGGNYTIASTGGAVLTLAANGAGNPVITTNADAIISAPIAVATAWSKAGANTLVLSGANTFGGPVAVTAGTLQAKTTASFPNYASPGSYSVASGATLAVNAGGSGEWTSANIDTLRSAPTYVANAAIGIDTTDGNFSYGSVISGSIGFAKLGANTLILPATQTYTGTTRIGGGTLLVAGGSNPLASTALQFSGTGTLDLAGGAESFAAIGINDGTFTGAITNGSATYTTPGTLGANGGTFDLSGLSNFTFNQPNGSLNINGNPTTFILAQGAGGNSIIGSAFNVGTGGTNTTTNVALGTSNTLNVDSLQIGNYHANGSIGFAGGLTNPQLTLRGQAGGATRISSVVVGFDSAGAQSQYGVLDTSGGTIDARIGTLTIGSNGLNSGTATATGTFTMNAGTLDATNVIIAQSRATAGGVGGVTTGIVNQQAGTLRAGTLTLGLVANTAQAATTLNATYNLGTATTAATLQASSITAGALTATASNTTATRTINFTNGTIQNFNDGVGTVTDLNISGVSSAASGLLNINLASSGLHAFLVDTGQTTTIQSTALLTGTLGTLTKTGGGTMRVLSASSYTGATAINGGTLDVVGSLAATAVTVGSNGTLAGSGSVGGAVNSSGTVAPGDGSGNAAKLTLSGLTLATNSTLAFDLGTASGRDLISTTTLKLNPSLLCVVTRGTTFGIGTYSLIDYTAVTDNSGQFSNWSVSGLSNSFQYSFGFGTDAVTSAQALNLIVSAPEPTAATAAFFGMMTVLGRRRRRHA